MDERLVALEHRVAAAAAAWLTDPCDAGAYRRLVDAVEARGAYLNPRLAEHTADTEELLDELADTDRGVSSVRTDLAADPAAVLARLRGTGSESRHRDD